MKMIFYVHANKIHFHKKGSAHSLVLKIKEIFWKSETAYFFFTFRETACFVIIITTIIIIIIIIIITIILNFIRLSTYSSASPH